MSDNNDLEKALAALQNTAQTFGTQLYKDARVREAYNALTKEHCSAIRASVAAGDLTAEQGAKAAYQMRDELLEMMRLRSSGIGRSAAKQLKDKSPAFEALLDKYARKLANKSFEALSDAEKTLVFEEVIASSGRANPAINARMAKLGRLSRGLWVLAIGISVYNIAVSSDKIRQIYKEGGALGGALLFGGALAEIGALGGPVGAIVGAIVGGILGGLIGDKLGELIHDTPRASTRCTIGNQCYMGFGEVMGRDGIIRPVFGPRW